MDNLETARKQMKIIAGTLGKKNLSPPDLTSIGNLINIARFYVQLDIAKSLRIIAGHAMEDK